jgi:nitroreductase
VAEMSIDELLTTTRAVRKRLDLTRPVDPALLRACMEQAVQAPSASNRQDWHFVFVTDPDRRAALAELYRRSYEGYRRSSGYAGRVGGTEPERVATQTRVASSADHLAEVLDQVPVLLVPCVRRRLPPDAPQAAQASLYGSILPAVWSFMLAARARGLGTAWTTLHLVYEQEAAEILDLPGTDVTQVALIPVAHYTRDTFRPAPRQPLAEVVSVDRFGQPPAW